MKRILVMAALLLALGIPGKAQDEEAEKKGFQKEKLFFGGNFGLTFGDYTFVNLSPQVGYRFHSLFAAGIGVNAQYVRFRERGFDGTLFRSLSQGVAGLNLFGRVYPLRQVMLQIQPEVNYVFGRQTYYNPQQTFKLDAEIVPSLLAGAGVVLPSGRSAFIISVQYDLLQRELSPYGNRPFVSFGYNIGY